MAEEELSWFGGDNYPNVGWGNAWYGRWIDASYCCNEHQNS